MKKNETYRYETKVLFRFEHFSNMVDSNPLTFTSKNKEQLLKDFKELGILNDKSVYQYLIFDVVKKINVTIDQLNKPE